MRTIPIKVWNRIEMLQAPIAAEIPTENPNQRRWAAISCTITFNAKSLSLLSAPLYSLSDIVFDVDLLKEHSPASDEDYAIVRKAVYYADDTTQLYELLGQLDIDPASFNAPWHVGHPLL